MAYILLIAGLSVRIFRLKLGGPFEWLSVWSSPNPLIAPLANSSSAFLYNRLKVQLSSSVSAEAPRLKNTSTNSI